jgi:GAF domain-containing protein
VSNRFLENYSILPLDETVQWVIKNQSPKVVEDISKCGSYLNQICMHEQVCSLACIPVVVHNQTVAILIYMTCSKVAFTVWEVQVMTTIANHVAAVSKLKLIDETCCPPQISPLFDRLRLAMASNNIDELLHNTLREALTLLHADSGSVIISDAKECRIAAYYGLPEGIDLKVTRRKKTISNYILAGRQPILIHGPADISRYPGIVPRKEIASSMCLPLKGKHKVLGLLNINRTAHKRPFTEEDLIFATTYISEPLSAALESKKLRAYREDQTKFLRHLYKIARTITSSLELQNVFNMILDRLTSLAKSDVCGLIIHEDKTGEFKVACGRGISNASVEDYEALMLPSRKLSISRARPTVINDLEAHPILRNNEIVKSLGLRSALILPLVIKRKQVGFIMAYSCQPRTFSQSLVRLLIGLGELAAIAIENARHYERQLGIAHITQQLLAPCAVCNIPGFDIGYKYIPAYQIGGDYYDILKLQENKFALAIADVSGKDVEAATHIAMCKHSLRAIAPHFHSPSSILKKMNHLIYENTTPEAFVSMLYAVLDVEQRQLQYSSAGHDPGLLLRAESKTIEQVATPGILLGINPDFTFVDKTSTINPGDILFLYTDGLVSALSKDYETGISILTSTLTECSLQPAQEVADNIYELAMNTHTSRLPDDIAFIVLKAVDE